MRRRFKTLARRSWRSKEDGQASLKDRELGPDQLQVKRRIKQSNSSSLTDPDLNILGEKKIREEGPNHEIISESNAPRNAVHLNCTAEQDHADSVLGGGGAT